MRLNIVIFSTIFLIVGCVSTNVVDDSHPKNNTDTNSHHTNKSQNNASNTNVSSSTNKNTNTSNTNTSNTNTSNTNTGNTNTSNTNTSSSSYQNIAPTINEESVLAQYNITQLLSADGDDDDWKKFREAYIAQYLRDPKYLPTAFEKDIAKNVIEYLKKGYGMYWSPVKGIEKELEYGFLAIRSNNSTGIDSHINALASHGKSSGYYTLLYIAAMHYVKNNNIEKAKSIATENDLFQNIKNFAIDIPEADLQKLRTSIGI